MACASKLVNRQPGGVQNTSVSWNLVEGNVRLGSQCPRTFPVESSFLSLFAAFSGSQAASMVRREKCLMDPCQHVTKKLVASSTSENQKRAECSCSSATRAFGISWNLVGTAKSSIPDHRLATAVWKFIAAQHFNHFQRQLRSLGCHINILRSADSGAVDLPITGFAIKHNHDAEVGGPLKGPFE